MSVDCQVPTMLMHLRRRGESGSKTVKTKSKSTWVVRVNLRSIKLSKPNVFVLDYALYRIDKGPWHDSEEILRIGNMVQESLGFTLKGEAYCQTWTFPSEELYPIATLTLQYTFCIQPPYPNAKLPLSCLSIQGCVLFIT
jgi:hypothetical protein